jgi:hypothetical protein
MTSAMTSPLAIFSELGETQWDDRKDAFEVRTLSGATLMLFPEPEDEAIPKRVIVDEIVVPELQRRSRVATRSLAALCDLADKYQFALLAGPIGFPDHPWGEKFVEWVLRFGFTRDDDPYLHECSDAPAFYVRREALLTAPTHVPAHLRH